jgi:hypothetical protein
MINPYLPSIGEHIRWLDILSIIGLPILLWQVNRKRIPTLVGLGVVVLLLIPWLLMDWQTDAEFGTSLSSLSVHWLGLSVIAVALLMVNGKERGREGFALGVIAGALGNCLFLYLQYRGYTPQLIKMGLSYPGTSGLLAAASRGRFFGLHGHANGSAAVISMCVPAAVALTTEFRRSWLFVMGAIAICIPGALLTSSRSAFLVAGLILLIWLFQFRSRYKYFIVPIFLIGACALVGELAYSQLNERWSESAQTDDNAALRWETTKESALAIPEFPLGMGSNFHQRLNPPLNATHNAFTALALCSGLPFAILVLVSIINSARNFRNGGSAKTWLALQLFGICLFEEHFSNPTFIVLTLWIVLTNIEDGWNAIGQSGRSAPLPNEGNSDFKGAIVGGALRND